MVTSRITQILLDLIMHIWYSILGYCIYMNYTPSFQYIDVPLGRLDTKW